MEAERLLTYRHEQPLHPSRSADVDESNFDTAADSMDRDIVGAGADRGTSGGGGSTLYWHLCLPLLEDTLAEGVV